MRQAKGMIQTALIVEDDTAVLNAYRRGLEHATEMRVLTAPDLGMARELLRQHHLDLAIIDLQLPDGSGIELIGELRAAAPRAFIALVSAVGSIESAVHAMRAGADDVIPKPVTVTEILRRVACGTAPQVSAVHTPTLDSAIWQHVHRVLADCNGNVSMTARLLGMHRSRLRRLLSQQAPHA